MSARTEFVFPPVNPEFMEPEIETSAEMRADYAAAMPHTELCQQNCEGGRRHPITWRIHPRPDPGPVVADGVITELIECCTCCAWSCGSEGFVDRLQRESFDGRDIEIHHLVRGQWIRFESVFPGVA